MRPTPWQKTWQKVWALLRVGLIVVACWALLIGLLVAALRLVGVVE